MKLFCLFLSVVSLNLFADANTYYQEIADGFDQDLLAHIKKDTKIINLENSSFYFGQIEVWNLYDPLTYQHPLVPYDVLIDEQSMPHHEIMNDKDAIQDIIHTQQHELEKAKEMLSNFY